jgi:hypothetical protein
VLDAGGDPVADARVGLAKAASQAFLKDGHFYGAQNQAQVVTTDETGKFTFPPQREPFLLIANHDSGFAEVTQEQFEGSSEIRLRAWGRIEGRVLLGDKPEANCTLQFSSRLADASRAFVLSCVNWARTDTEGRFRLERVMPGSGCVSRLITTQFPRLPGPFGGSLSPGWQQWVNVKPSETVIVAIGGTGRSVAGRLELSREPDIPIDWTTNWPVAIQRWDVENERAEEATFTCQGKLDEVGRFEIPDVPPGAYRLTCRVWGAFSVDTVGYPPTVGNAEYDFTVRPVGGERNDEAVDLGVITVEVDAKSE